jgi:hypothetical protein
MHNAWVKSVRTEDKANVQVSHTCSDHRLGNLNLLLINWRH